MEVVIAITFIFILGTCFIPMFILKRWNNSSSLFLTALKFLTFRQHRLRGHGVTCVSFKMLQSKVFIIFFSITIHLKVFTKNQTPHFDNYFYFKKNCLKIKIEVYSSNQTFFENENCH